MEIKSMSERAREMATWIEIKGLRYIPRVDGQVYNACLKMGRSQRKVDAEHAWEIIERRLDRYFGEKGSTEKYVMFKKYFVSEMLKNWP